jgi:hypothetical protein
MGRLQMFHEDAPPHTKPDNNTTRLAFIPFFEVAQKVEGEGVFSCTVQFFARSESGHFVEVGTANPVGLSSYPSFCVTGKPLYHTKPVGSAAS